MESIYEKPEMQVIEVGEEVYGLTVASSDGDTSWGEIF